MWRAAGGRLKHRGLRTGRADFYRWNTTAAGPESFHELTDLSLHIHASTAYSQLRSSDRSRPCSYSAAAAPLEHSLTTLDAALSSVIQLPLFSNPLLQILPPDGESSSRTVFRIDQKWPFQLKAVATEACFGEEEEVGVLPELEEIHDISLERSSKFEGGKALKAARARARRLFNRQQKLELDAWDAAVREYRKILVEMCRKKLAPNLPFAKSLMVSWFEPVRDEIAKELKAIEKEEPGEDRSHYGPLLKGAGLTADVLAVITMHRLVALMMQDVDSGCIRLANTAVLIGDAVEQEIKIRRALKKRKPKELAEEAEPPTPEEEKKEYLKDKLRRAIIERPRNVKEILKSLDPSQPWPSFIQAKLGCRLIDIMMSNSHINVPVSDCPEDGTEIRPAFRHVLKVPKGGLLRSYGAIVCDPHLRGRIDDSAKFIVMPYMPMLIPPRAWKGYHNGAYLHLRSVIMRTHGSKQQREAVRNTPRAQLQQVFRALDTLGAASWKINKEVFEVIEKLWSAGGGIGGLVDRKDVPLPPKPNTEDEAEMRSWRKVFYKGKRTNSERNSQRCDLELKLAVARSLKDEECFYYPHNLDFRGRAYPMHAHLNHLGSDVCRGMLLFAKGRPLGPTGLRWLKIHIANVFANGADKLPFDGRVAFAESNLEHVVASANQPLKNRWWLKAEDPFQCLAACIDLRNAMHSPNPEYYISHLPVHQDGSCNGLQHYAALGRDKTGARAVNLIGADYPADVYSGIAARVRTLVEEDARKDPAAVYAKLLVGHVDRKLVKQTVMTSVYGVTYVGARNQITNRLRDKGFILDEPTLYRTGCYAAKVTLNALGEMFGEARLIMNWLGQCAKVIANDGDSVRWITPLGLPVVQPYRRPGRHVVKTCLQCLILRTDTDQPVLAARQRSAFPPNFVHSMDGSHMMMTAVACQEAGLTFAGVHDSFWTHAGDVERMNVILREKFVELYEQPILENLLESFQKRWPKLKFPDLPVRGDLDLKEVLSSPYFFN
ncbi:DNA-directed RNA polymerase 1B, mitochondrial isoform X2 [Selaginella moellendorffii]|uniref:DNA-directed RNA polymerase n=2 Tax=Selaginella moellendorffii TaxID=88036 RepID=B2RFX8_SELML|nr:DNA-directed RNA polymerase 1B, mitochondrial isoform X2 [Selaginella moellendorffii]CAP70041.1 RNA polymerase [Selaginella moellendorffii]|eukprot:XP_002978135.2 DNA-directed RNA polymerase 1B, mitochondrial isoform X2 [Selaginella moellendorffii]